MGVGGRRRRAGGWLSVVAVGMLFVAACSSGSNVVVQAPAAAGPSGTDPSQASGEPTPKVGDCRAPLDHTIIDAASDPRPTVDCSQAHGSETFWVGSMSANIEAWPGSDDRAGALLENQVTRECGTRHLQYLGLDIGTMPNLPPDRLQSFAFFVPTERDYQDGARWFRCDAVVEPLAAERTSIDGTLKDVYAKPLPVSYRLCEARLGQPVACDQDHEIEYLASVAARLAGPVPDPEGRHPGDRGVPHAAAHRPRADGGADGPGVRLPPTDTGGVGRRVQGRDLRGRRRPTARACGGRWPTSVRAAPLPEG